MTYPQSSDSWEALCAPDKLAFRAACNTVVGPSLRPIKRRVIARISSSKEARSLFVQSWERFKNLETSDTAKFFELLTALPVWQTLVIEEIAAEHRWTDLFSKNAEGFVEKSKALIEKLWDKYQHPTARALSAFALGLGTIYVANGSLTIHVKPVLSQGDEIPVVFRPSNDKDAKPIPVSFVPTADVKGIPVKLELDSDDKPIKLRFDCNGKPADEIAYVVEQLQISNRSLAQVASGLNSVAKASAALDGADLRSKLKDISTNISSNATKLKEIHDGIEKGLGDQSAVAKREAEYVDQHLGVMATAAAIHRNIVPLVIDQGGSQSIMLSSFDPVTGRSESKIVDVHVSKITQGKAGKLVPLAVTSENQTLSQLHDRKEGEVISLQGVPWKLAVNAIDKHWYRSRVSVTFVQDMTPVPMRTIELQSPNSEQKTAANEIPETAPATQAGGESK
jgi:hypothetical protein